MRNIDRYEMEINHLLDELEDNPSSRKKVTEKLTAIRFEVESQIKESDLNLTLASRDIKQYSNQINDENIPDKDKVDLQKKIAFLQDDSAVWQHKLCELKHVKGMLDEYLEVKNYFDKYKCYQNIRELIRIKGVKLGQIENDAGVRIGYLSRLDKPDNDSEPGILFLISAANLLGVTVDELINGDMQKMTKNEAYLCDFLRDLISDTDEGIIHWEKQNISKKNPVYTAIMNYPPQFNEGSDVSVLNHYAACIPESKNYVHVLKCGSDKGEQGVPENTFIEVYISDETGKFNAIGSSVKSGVTAGELMRVLCNKADRDSESVYIDIPTREIIDTYRKKRGSAVKEGGEG